MRGNITTDNTEYQNTTGRIKKHRPAKKRIHISAGRVLRAALCYVLIVALLLQNDVLISQANAENVSAAQAAALAASASSISPQEIPADKDVQTTQDVEAAAPEPEIISEIEDKRDIYSKEYLMSDNSRVLVIYPQPIHYENEDGNLAEINNTLIKTEDGYENVGNSYQMLISDNEDSRGEVTYRENDYEITWRMMQDDTNDIITILPETDTQDDTLILYAPEDLDMEVTDVVTENDVPQEDEDIYRPKQSKITLDGYDGGVKVEYLPVGDGIKENIILETRESGNEYIFGVRLSGLKAALNSNNEIVFYDEETDEIQYYFPAPFMTDSRGEVSYAAKYVIMNDAVEIEDTAETEPYTETEDETETEETSKSETYTEAESESDTETKDNTESDTDTQDANLKSKILTQSSKIDGEDFETSESQGTTTPEADSEANDESQIDETDFETSDSQGATTPESDSQETSDSQTASDDDTIYLKITIDEQWLDQASYPVTLDPVLKQARAKNLTDYGCVASDGTTYDTLYVGKNQNITYRTFFRFELPDMETGSIISEAKLQLGGSPTEGNTHYLKANIVTQDWYNKAEQPSGKKLAWSNQPAMGDLLDYALNAGYFNITKAVRKWQSGEKTNYGIAVSAYDESVSRRDAIHLKDSATVPYLKITYRIATGLESYWNTHTTAAGTAGAGYINDYTGTLTVVNTAVATAGLRMPMNISHIYNSNETEDGTGWRLNYDQTITIPTDTVDVSVYPYLYTDEDGTKHYFKKGEIYYLLNGVTRKILTTAEVPAAQDEDGLGLYIVPVQDTTLKTQYPLKLVNKDASIVKYFDTSGKLAMITDSNQYENTKNKDTKEQNAIKIKYETIGQKYTLNAYDAAVTAAETFRTTCAASSTTINSDVYIRTRDAVINALTILKKDPYAQADYNTAKQINAAQQQMDKLTDTTGNPTKSAAKTASTLISTYLKKARTQAQTLPAIYDKRISAVTDAVGNCAQITYDAKGRINTITDPAHQGQNSYAYDSQDNLIQITYADGKTARYTYDADHLLTSQRDHDGYRIQYTYRKTDNRVIKVEEYHNSTPGQTYSIAYNPDNTTSFRYSGVDDIYGNDDDIENINVFDEQGRITCTYSKSVNENKIIGAAACTYADDSDNANKRNKIKDTAVIGMHADNLLKNHSFEYNDGTWTLYKNNNQTPETGALSAYSTSKKYIGLRSATVNMAKRTGGTAGFKQSKQLTAGTYTLSAYCKTTSIKNTAAYLKVTDAAGNNYTGAKITNDTDALFNNGWERLQLTFTINTAQTVTVWLETDCGTQTGAGTVAFDCVQLETGDVANDYNILEDASFEFTETTIPYNWTTLSTTGITVQDRKVTDCVDGKYAYCITGQPGKDKYLRFKTNLGDTRNSYTLSGWIKTDTTPTRTSRSLKARAYHKFTDTDDSVVEYIAESELNGYAEGWQYFCLLLPAKAWGDTSLTICFYDNIGELIIDGLQLTQNDVQTKSYDAQGKLTSRYTAQKTATATYDNYNRVEKQTTASGASTTRVYDANNEIKQIKAGIGPDTYYKYDKYGNIISVSEYDPNTTKLERYTQTTYTANGNFKTSDTDPAGNKTTYEYNTLTGQLNRTTLPKRTGEDSVQVNYTYDSKDRITSVKQGTRSIEYEYGAYDDLTAIKHNGFTYGYTYDGFGNVLTSSVAGSTLSTNEYASNNGTLKKTTMADGTIISVKYDEYGKVTARTINGAPVEQYTYDNDGNIARKKDMTAGLTTAYEYNDSNQPVRTEVYKNNSANTDIPESRMQYTYTKGGNVADLSYQEKGGAIKTYAYTYDKDDLPAKATLPDKSVVTWSYDSLRRNTKTVYTPQSGATDTKKLYTVLQYQPSQFTVDGKVKNTTTDLVSTYTNKFGNTGSAVSEYTYTYDTWGSITKIKDLAGRQRTYTYNKYGEIANASETYSDGTTTTYAYTYDDGGNILTETIGNTEHKYNYDSVWKDKLTSYDGKAITYDDLGRPKNYMGKSMTWDKAGKLASVGSDIRYTYLSDGQRYTKTANGKTTTYNYNNGLLLSETNGDETLRYYYDSTGKIISFTYQKGTGAETSYFYTRNMQGDITAIYRNSDSMLIGTYEYDLWGKLVKAAPTSIDTQGVLTKNPFRYRGYYYDAETGFYNLNARYYDPEVRRFISPDNVEYLGVGDSLTSYNLFAYCGNDPIMGYDPTGHWDWGGVLIGSSIVLAVVISVATFGIGTPAALLVASGGVALGTTMTYAAATDTPMVVDGSFSVPDVIEGRYYKTGVSFVADFKNDNVNAYIHGGGGVGFSAGPSASVGLVDNYNEPRDYAGPFFDVNAGCTWGIDHCWNPERDYNSATKATCFTIGSGLNFGSGYDYYQDPIHCFSW